MEVKDLYSYPLKNYLKDARRINIEIAKLYVKEVIYKHTAKNIIFYGIGFKCDETWVIRRNGFKGFLGKGANITIIDQKTENLLLFERFIDFLSHLTAKGINKPNNTVIVLNSASFINRVSEFIESNPQIKSIDYFRDRDQAGLEGFNKLASNLKSIIIRDKSETYLNHKDLNERLTNEYTRT